MVPGHFEIPRYFRWVFDDLNFRWGRDFRGVFDNLDFRVGFDGHMAMSSQGMQDHLRAKSANWLAS